MKYQLSSFENIYNAYPLGNYKNFYKMIRVLESKGYVKGIDVFMLPYDWRTDPLDSQMMP